MANYLSFQTDATTSASSRRLLCLRVICLSSLLILLLFTFPARGAVDSFVSEDVPRLLELNSTIRVAVLPVENFTVSPTAAVYFRGRIVERLKAKGYSVLDQRQTDETLNHMGISHAGQIGQLPFEELAKNLYGEWYLSGAVEQAAVQNAGVYNAYVYSASLKIQDETGKLLWSALQGRVAKRRFALDPVNAVLDVLLVAEGGSVEEAMMALADQLLATLPEGPSKIVLGDSLLGRAMEIEVTTHE